MKGRSRLVFRTGTAVLALAAGLVLAGAQTPSRFPDASSPVAKTTSPDFFRLHESFLARGKADQIGLLFLGDSITARWESAPAVWEKYYGRYAPANFGIRGDATQHVIWRIEHGELDGIHPRVVVLLMGTNNILHYTPDQIVAADTKIVRLIREKIPEVKVLLLGIFPRGPHRNGNGTGDDGVQAMTDVRAINSRLAELDDGVNVRFLDFGARFLGPDGKIRPDLTVDQLHPTMAGYEIWAEAMQPLVDSMMEGWRSVPRSQQQRVALRRRDIPPPAEEETWMAHLPADIVVEPNLRYAEPAGSDPRLTSLDVFRPKEMKRRGAASTVIFIHGGGMSAGDKSPAALVENKARFFPAHGFIFVTTNYRLAPEVGYPTAEQDVAAAIAFVRRHAANWGGNPDSIYLIGHSGGAQIAAHLATQPGFLEAAHVPRIAIRGVVVVDSSICDLPYAWDHDGGDPQVHGVIGMTYGVTRHELEAASPVGAIGPGARLPPLLIFHSADPKSLSAVAAERFAERARAAGAQVQIEPAREKDHSHLGRDIGNPGDWITDDVMRFIATH